MIETGLIMFNRGPYSSAENLARYAQQAESLGYHFLAVNDHVVISHHTREGYGDKSVDNTRNYFDPLMTMMYLGGLTKSIRIGASVLILPHRPPVQTAKALSSLDVFLGGRLFLGVGAGWWPEEFQALGIGDHFASRGDRTDETLQIFKNLWSQPNPSFEGPFHQYGEIEFSPKPLQTGGPQIWVGGNKGRALRRMVEMGDVWHPTASKIPGGYTAKAFGENRDKLAGMMEKAGRDPGSLKIALRANVRLTSADASPVDPFEGSPDHLVETIRAYGEHGMTHLAVYFKGETDGTPFSSIMEQMQQLAEEVLPRCH